MERGGDKEGEEKKIRMGDRERGATALCVGGFLQ